MPLELVIDTGQKRAFVSNISYTNFDDLKMGKHGPDDYLRPEYVVTENGQDIIVQNDDPRLQRFTGYDQINVMQKFHYKANDRISYDLGLHYSSTSEYPRYDRLILYENDELRSAEWNYGACLPTKYFHTDATAGHDTTSIHPIGCDGRVGRVSGANS